MKGYRFYEELRDKNRKGELSRGTVIAACPELANPFTGDFEGAAAVYDEPNAPVCGTGLSRDYLSADCRRISERRAREIHPALFDYLESDTGPKTTDLQRRRAAAYGTAIRAGHRLGRWTPDNRARCLRCGIWVSLDSVSEPCKSKGG